MALAPDCRFQQARRSCLIWIATAIVAAPPALAQSSRDESSLLVVRVVTKDGEYPLAYSSSATRARRSVTRFALAALSPFVWYSHELSVRCSRSGAGAPRVHRAKRAIGRQRPCLRRNP